MRSLALSVFLLAVSINQGYAQGTPDSVKHRNECRFAEQILTTGEPRVHTEWARQYIQSCGYERWGQVAAQRVLRLRTSSDLDALGKEWRPLNFLADGNVFAAAMEIAADPAASVGSRVLALRYLLAVIDPNGVYGYGAMTSPVKAGSPPRCVTARTSGTVTLAQGAALPVDARTRSRALAATLLTATAVPREVQAAATCVASAPVYPQTAASQTATQ